MFAFGYKLSVLPSPIILIYINKSAWGHYIAPLASTSLSDAVLQSEEVTLCHLCRIFVFSPLFASLHRGIS